MQHQGQEQALTLGNMGVKTRTHVLHEEKNLQYFEKCEKENKK